MSDREILERFGETAHSAADRTLDSARKPTPRGCYSDLDVDLVADSAGEWAAVEPGTSRVLEFVIDGSSASGSASFINEDRAFNPANLPLPPIMGTFEVHCGP